MKSSALWERLPPRQRRILSIALPIIGGMVSQNILNLVDTAMVAHLGDAALAASGIGGFANFMATAFITGLGVGVQTIASRRYGEGRLDETAVSLNGGLLLALALAIPLTGILYTLVPDLFLYLSQDPAVLEGGVPYLQVRLLGAAALGCNFAFRGYWNGVDLSRLYMRTLIIMHVANVILNAIFIFGLLGLEPMGVVGAALGTMLSTYLGTAIYVYLAFKHAREAGFLRGLPDRETLLSMVKLSVPAGLQSFFFATGMTVFFAIVGQVGTPEQAASQVIVNLLLVGILPGIGFGLAAASLVGQSLGKGEPEEAETWGWVTARTAMVVVGMLAIPGILFPELLLMPFLHDPETLQMALGPVRLLAFTIAFDVGGLVLMNALYGAGASRLVMVTSTGMQWLVGLPLIYLVGPQLELGLFVIWCAQVGYRLVQGVVFAIIWKLGRWKEIEV